MELLVPRTRIFLSFMQIPRLFSRKVIRSLHWHQWHTRIVTPPFQVSLLSSLPIYQVKTNLLNMFYVHFHYKSSRAYGHDVLLCNGVRLCPKSTAVDSPGGVPGLCCLHTQRVIHTQIWESWAHMLNVYSAE